MRLGADQSGTYSGAPQLGKDHRGTNKSCKRDEEEIMARIAGGGIPCNKQVEEGLTYIYGGGQGNTY